MTMELDLRDYIRIIRKRIWLIASFVILACLATGIVSYTLLQPIYEASTKLIVNKSQDNATMNQLDINAINTNISLINTYKEIIKTPAIMDKVVAENPQFGLTAQQLSDKVRVSSVNNTQVMTLVVQDPSYTKAAKMVNAISEVFQREIPHIMKVDNVSLLNKADLQAHPNPVKPNPNLNIAISFVVSLMLIIGVVFLLEYLDDTVKTETDVERFLELPTLALVAKVKDEDIVQMKKSLASKRQAGETARVTLNQ